MTLTQSFQTLKEPQAPLASSLAAVQVDFNTVEFPDSPDTFQNDGVSGRDRKPNQDPSLSDILIGIPLNDEKKFAGDHHGKKHGIFSFHPAQSHSALEIGTYVLLSTFCFAIVVFVISCFVYASKHKMASADPKLRTNAAVGRANAGAVDAVASSVNYPMLRESGRKHRDSTTNAHNWVWLGRSTMDRSSVIPENGEQFINPRGTAAAAFEPHSDSFNRFPFRFPDSRIRITRNPLPANYIEAHDSIQPASTFAEGDHHHITPNVRIKSGAQSLAHGRGHSIK